jgi:hypothetical protein
MLGKLGQPIPRTYQLEEELGLICLQSSLGVQGDVGAARVILSAEGRGKGEFLDELRSGKELLDALSKNNRSKVCGAGPKRGPSQASQKQ